MIDIFTNFIVAVAAQVAATYLCKWLESHRTVSYTHLTLPTNREV